jgi:3-deoxy-D-manno-octulosonate 8-phosphate phosphatase (KDO 8-P phosphatase)
MIKVLLLDVDGVLTDGSIIYSNSGQEFKVFNIKDGFGIRLAQKCGVEVIIISGRRSIITEIRAHELGIEKIYQAVENKEILYENLKLTNGWIDEEVAFIGDDINDVELMKKVGLSATVMDAFDYVKTQADIVVPLSGGCGAVRYFIDHILKINNQWENIIK